MDNRLIELLGRIESDSELAGLLSKSLLTGKHLNITGLCAEQKVYVGMALARLNNRKAVFIEPDAARARTTAAYCAAFTDGNVTLLTPSELSLVSAEASSRELELGRSVALSELVTGNFGAAVITAGALLNRLEPAKVFEKRIIRLKTGQEMERDELVDMLVLNGYENVPQVMEKGEFSVRGDIVDIFSPSYTEPVRISFFDTEIDQIKTFDRETQRSTGQLEETTAVPASCFAFPEDRREEISELILERVQEDLAKMNTATREVRRAAELLSRTATGDAEKIRNGIVPTGIARWLGLILENFQTALDYINEDDVVVFADEMVDIDARLNAYAGEYAQRCRESFEIGIAPTCSPSALVSLSKLMRALDNLGNIVTLSMFQSSGNGLPGGVTHTVTGFPADNFSGRAEELAAFLKKNQGVYLVAHHGRRSEQLKERLAEYDCFHDIIDAPLPAGFTYPLDMSITEKIETIAKRIYRADSVGFDLKAEKQIKRLEAQGYGNLPICMAKTQFSFSDDPTLLGAPTGFKIHVTDVKPNSGAGFIVARTGDIMTMPGLPKRPSAENIDVDNDGHVTGLF